MHLRLGHQTVKNFFEKLIKKVISEKIGRRSNENEESRQGIEEIKHGVFNSASRYDVAHRVWHLSEDAHERGDNYHASDVLDHG